jgi:hypothetical protein
VVQDLSAFDERSINQLEEVSGAKQCFGKLVLFPWV